VENWSRKELLRAPAGMRNGWFVSQLELYDLQKSLQDDTVAAIAVSLSVAFIVVLLTTLNPLLSLFAIANITSTIFVTIAVLILLGWRLNVLEAVAVSVAIGLAVDFSIHYVINYK
jgi:predicted RND superfamily exporter protein